MFQNAVRHSTAPCSESCRHRPKVGHGSQQRRRYAWPAASFNTPGLHCIDACDAATGRRCNRLPSDSGRRGNSLARARHCRCLARRRHGRHCGARPGAEADQGAAVAAAGLVKTVAAGAAQGRAAPRARACLSSSRACPASPQPASCTGLPSARVCL
jgi:hypothetical protein